MKAAIYSRKSKFTGKGESIENQVQMCIDYAKNIGIEDFYIYEDEGFSGKNIDRPQFQKMIKDAKDKKFDVLICYRLDRISRNIADFSALIQDLQDMGISFISIREQFDTSTPMGRAMMYIASVFAQLERETISERIRDNMHELAKTGRWLGGQAPLGYDSEQIVYFDENMKERKMYKLSANEEELKIVKLIFKKYLETKSLSQVHKYMLINNIKGKNGGNLAKGSINDILKNPVYVKADEQVIDYLESLGISVVGKPDKKHGILTYSKRRNGKETDMTKWIAAISKHKGVIDSKDWLLVQKILEKNKAKAPRTDTSHTAILTGVIKCKCGSGMRVIYGKKRKNGTKPFYYTCTMKNDSGGTRCKSKNLNGTEVENIVINEIKKINKNILIQEYKNVKNHLSNNDNLIEIENINKKIVDNESAISNLVKQLSKNIDSIASNYIISEIEKLNEEISKLKEKLNELNQNKKMLNNNLFNIDMVLEALNRFNKEIDNASIEDKRFLISMLVDKIIWDYESGEIKIIYWGGVKKN
ncbi:recombinase family protein [Tepidibacter thalassicus]|uniref:Site-specific DNA recombinase n=1 Tax=Tepidibacter thalassicus DSM 15285 TaxID=1123350 RepID=A0A1M5PYM1_9FIRM|nr:recombinase family protein [Tepidibacter thalassicus]SHH06559.1 Site-specific DNA recombinase [Tepidibacter thalassicus DSM 15285]